MPIPCPDSSCRLRRVRERDSRNNLVFHVCKQPLGIGVSIFSPYLFITRMCNNTFCFPLDLQDVVYALAHATGKTGRFTLIERWRNNERLLAPQEHPLKVS